MEFVLMTRLMMDDGGKCDVEVDAEVRFRVVEYDGKLMIVGGQIKVAEEDQRWFTMFKK